MPVKSRENNAPYRRGGSSSDSPRGPRNGSNNVRQGHHHTAAELQINPSDEVAFPKLGA